MKNFYGPYFRADINDKWHWRKDCPEYPFDSENSLIASQPPSPQLLCDTCTKLEQLDSEKERAKDTHQYL
jgi:hypothetical protein